MKKKLLLFVFMIIYFTASHVFAQNLILEYDGAQHEYTGSVYKLMVNDEYVESAMHPIIFNDYALVPIREVFESMGATVKYFDISKQIFIEYENNFLRLQIGSTEAYLNSETLQIPGDVSPKLIALAGSDAKTMVPVRFVSESIGFLVDFDGENGIIKINTPEEDNTITLTDFKCTSRGDTATLKITADREITDVSKPILTEKNVLYTDILNGAYALANSNTINKGAIKTLRFGQHDNMVRIALDLDSCESYTVKLSADKMTVIISVTASPKDIEDNDNNPDDSENSDNVADSPITDTPNKKIVVLDAGHGGTDPGALGYIDTESYNEKDINLAVTLAIRDILVDNGVDVILTRDGDTYPTLTERAEIANENCAVIFVSIHSNSATSQAASGYEVYYSNRNNSKETGLSSSELAKSIIECLSENVDTRNRGIKTADHVVTYSSLMPAVLVEIGFMSNPDELSLMLTKKFRNSFANGVAEGILAVLSKANPPSKTISSEKVALTSDMADSEKSDTPDGSENTSTYDKNTTDTNINQ